MQEQSKFIEKLPEWHKKQAVWSNPVSQPQTCLVSPIPAIPQKNHSDGHYRLPHWKSVVVGIHTYLWLQSVGLDLGGGGKISWSTKLLMARGYYTVW